MGNIEYSENESRGIARDTLIILRISLMFEKRIDVLVLFKKECLTDLLRLTSLNARRDSRSVSDCYYPSPQTRLNLR